MRAQRAPLRLTVSPARLCRVVYAGFLAVRGPSSTAGDGGYAGRDEITSDSTCIYGGLHRPSRPLLRGRIISQRDACPVWVFGMSRHVPPPISGRSIDRAGVRCDCKFNPLALGQIQNGADTLQRENVIGLFLDDFRGDVALTAHRV